MKAPRKYLAAAAFAAMAMAPSAPAWAHAALQSATPAKDAVVEAAPAEITLRFNEKLEAAFSNAKLLDSSGKVVSTQKATLDQADPSVMRLPVPALTAGRYKVEYVGVGHDGHRRRGDYTFTVK